MILAACGTLGSGKTLVVSLLATGEAGTGRRVFANYPLACATRITTLAQLLDIEQGVAVLDEAHVNIDSREYAKNVQLTSWLLQTRKIGLDLMYTTQSFGQVDLRLRRITDILLQCEPTRQGGRKGTKLAIVDAQKGITRSTAYLQHSPALYALYDTMARVNPLR